VNISCVYIMLSGHCHRLVRLVSRHPIVNNTIRATGQYQSAVRRFAGVSGNAATPATYTSRDAAEVLAGEDDSAERAAGYASQDNLFNEVRADPNRADPTGRTFSYIVAGSSAFLYASVARVAVVKFLTSWSASADVLALSSLEVDISAIQEGTSTTVKWRGKPVFVRYRTSKEIEMAHNDDKLVSTGGLRDPQLDHDRVQDDKWMIVMGICTHLGCVPIPNSGDYHGWFCPCHGSHYDTSGRIRKGPAPLNLEVPSYKFLSPAKILIG